MNRQIFEEIQTFKRQILQNEKMILFGLQAHSNARENSDWEKRKITPFYKNVENESVEII